MGKSAERRQMTVMFVDIIGSTQRLQNCDPEEFFEYIIAYQSRVNDCVSKYEGTVARYIGDGVLVYFSWPVAQEDAAVRAIRTAHDILSAVSDLADPHDELTTVRIGIATGVVVIGEIITQSSQSQQEIFGEVPHLAERLQGTGGENTITVCQQTHKLASREFSFQKLAQQSLKGINGERTIYIAGPEKREPSRFKVSDQPPKLRTFGRQKELDFIEKLWLKARGGEGQIAWISGDAGIGKSHLVESIAKKLGQEKVALARYQCSKFHAQSPYYPFVKRTHIWSGINATDDPDTRLNKFVQSMDRPPDEEMLRNISPIMGFPKVRRMFPNRSEQEEKEAVCISLLELLKLAMRQQPLLILIEDLHWADPSSFDLVGYMNSFVKNLDALILVTYRDEIEAPSVNLPNSHKLELGRLNADDVKKMVLNVAGSTELDDQILDTIVSKTDGVPLYVDACTRAFIDSKNSQSIEMSFQGKMDVPFSLHDMLMERLDRLGDSRTIAQICSAIGHVFTAKLVQQISGRTTEDVENALGELLSADILMRADDEDIPVFSFHHSLIQDVAYQGLLKRTRRQLHLTIARVLETHYPDMLESEPEFIAEHFRVAERYSDAIQYLLKAANINLSKFANREAIEHADQAIVLIRKLDDQTTREKLELEFQLVKALAGRALYGFAKRSTILAFQRMMELATKHGSAKYYSQAIRGLFNALHAEGMYEEALAMADLMINNSQNEPHGLMTAHHMRAIPLIWQGKFREAERELGLAIEYCNKIDNEKGNSKPQQQETLNSTLAICLAFLGQTERSAELSFGALRHARQKDRTIEIANRYLNACNALRIIRHPEASKIAQEFQDFVADRELPYYSTAVSAFVGLAMFEEGEKQAGLEMLKSGWSQFTRTNSRLNQVFYMAELADCCLRAGDLEQAYETVSNGFELMNQFGERNFEAELHRIKGEILSADPSVNGSAARDEFENAIKISQSQSAKIFEKRAKKSLEHFDRLN